MSYFIVGYDFFLMFIVLIALFRMRRLDRYNEDDAKAEIEFKPLKKDEDFFKIRIQVDKVKNEVKYIKVFAKDGTTYTLDIKTIRTTSTDDSIFTFNKSKFLYL